MTFEEFWEKSEDGFKALLHMSFLEGQKFEVEKERDSLIRKKDLGSITLNAYKERWRKEGALLRKKDLGSSMLKIYNERYQNGSHT